MCGEAERFCGRAKGMWFLGKRVWAGFGNKGLGDDTPFGAPAQTRHAGCGIVCVKQTPVLLEEVLENARLFIDEALRKTVVAHGDGLPDPGDPRDEIGGKKQGAFFCFDFGQQHTGRMAIGEAKAIVAAQHLACGPVDNGEPAARFEQGGERLDETRSVAWMGRLGPSVCLFAYHKSCLRKEEPRRFTLSPAGQKAPGVVEMKMGEDHDVDVSILEAKAREVLEEHVLFFFDAITFAKRGFEERSNSGLKEHVAVAFTNQEGPRRERDAVGRIRFEPSRPERLGRMAKHGPPIEPLGVAEDRVHPHRQSEATIKTLAAFGYRNRMG